MILLQTCSVAASLKCLVKHSTKIQATIVDLFTYARDGNYFELDMSVKCR